MIVKEKLRKRYKISILRDFKWIHVLIIFSSWILVLIIGSIQNFIFLGYDLTKFQPSFFLFPSFVGLIFGILISRILVFRDDKKKYELTIARQEEEKKYRYFIEHSGDALYLLYKGHFEFINPKFTELFGMTIEEINISRFKFLEIIAPESREFIKERISRQLEGKAEDSEYQFKAFNKDKQILELETSVTYIPYKEGIATQGVIRDITEKRRLEQQLHQALKMEAIGTLAGGVAHDFNNLLTVINGYSEMALLKLEQNNVEYLHTAIKAISDAGKKAENLTRQLLAFSRKQIYKPEILDLNEIIEDTDKMLRRLIGADISIHSVFAESLPRIQADKSQLEQIFMNLVLNARDAIYTLNRENYSKKIIIETGYRFFEGNEQHIEIKRGKYVFFSISDNGVGMDSETCQKIFEPFFTTKEKFKGTGLGLSTVYGIVKQNNGYVYVYSEPNQGSTFKIYWPITNKKITKQPIQESKIKEFFGTGSILLVEDNMAVRQFASETLTSMGYDVHQASNGKKALEQVKEKQFEFDLIITDLIMPELNGKEFVEKAKQIYPNIKVLYVSGYTDNHIVHNGLLEKEVNFIHKPYSIKILAKEIERILHSSTPQTPSPTE